MPYSTCLAYCNEQFAETLLSSKRRDHIPDITLRHAELRINFLAVTIIDRIKPFSWVSYSSSM
jgi:hypothetical protein